jgi:hypothetical protein
VIGREEEIAEFGVLRSGSKVPAVLREEVPGEDAAHLDALLDRIVAQALDRARGHPEEYTQTFVDCFLVVGDDSR